MGESNTSMNGLVVQREYFELVLQLDPRNEAIRFALAQTLKDMGDQAAADAVYDQGIAVVDRLWLPKLFAFTLVSGGIGATLWWLAVPWWWCGLVAAIGPVLWLMIRRNRHRWLPQVGFMQRAGSIEQVNMPAEIARLREQMREANAGCASSMRAIDCQQGPTTR